MGKTNGDIRVVLTDSGPLPLGNVRAIFLPVLGPIAVLLKPALFDALDVLLVDDYHGGRVAASGMSIL